MMSQEEIIETLTKAKQPMTAEQISEFVESSLKAVRFALNKLEKYHEVERIKLPRKEVEAREIRYAGRHFVWKLVVG